MDTGSGFSKFGKILDNSNRVQALVTVDFHTGMRLTTLTNSEAQNSNCLVGNMIILIMTTPKWGTIIMATK